MACGACGNRLVKLIINYTAPKPQPVIKTPPQLNIKTAPKPVKATGPFKTIGS